MSVLTEQEFRVKSDEALESARRALAAYIDDMRAHLRECSTCAPDQYFFCSAALEIIKVRAPSLDRDARDEAFKTLCEKTGAEAVQQIGKIFVLYRKSP